MKLAEALIERKALKTKMEELKKRIYQNARIQEGEEPIESPLELLEALRRETEDFERLIVRINETNNVTKLSEDMTLMQAIVRKDMLHYLHLVHLNLADKASPLNDRYSQREIKYLPSVNVSDLRKTADEIAREYRQLDAKIQEANWGTELL